MNDSSSSARGPTMALTLFAVLASAYWVSLWLPPLPGIWVLKFSPMLVAAATLATRLRPSAAWPMAIGFVAAAGGDLFLALDRGELFTWGLACFLVTQLAYTVAFTRHARTQLRQRWSWWLPLLAFGLGLLAWMWPALDADRLPVTVYVVALVIMAMAAATVEAKPGRIFAGAALFVISDALIGVTRFVADFDHSLKAVIATYMIAQYLIFSGVLAQLPLRGGRPESSEHHDP